MRPATPDDLGVIDAINSQCSLPEAPRDVLETCLGFIGDHGYIVFDMQDSTHCIAHATIAKSGRGEWGRELFRRALRWLFTATKVECVRSMVPAGNPHAVKFGEDAWFMTVATTDTYTFTMCDVTRWMSMDPECLEAGKHAESGYSLADPEMVKRVAGACSMMHEAGMEHKAWYTYQLYAKLFGYKAEV